MELLDQLEQKIAELLARLESLSKENTSLKQANERDLGAFAEENDLLRCALEDERTKNAAALERIEGILERIRKEAGASEERPGNG